MGMSLTPLVWPRSFRIGFGALEAFCNDDGTRSFMAISVDEGKRELCRAIRAIDRAFRLFGLLAFHKVAATPRVALNWILFSDVLRIGA